MNSEEIHRSTESSLSGRQQPNGPPPVTPIVSEQQDDFDESPPEVKETQPTPPPMRHSKLNRKSQSAVSFS